MYAIALKKRYGNNILEELEELRKQKVLYSNIEYKKKIDIYKNKLKDNNFEFGTGKIIKS